MQIEINGIPCEANETERINYVRGTVEITHKGMTVALGATLTDAVREAKAALNRAGVKATPKEN